MSASNRTIRPKNQQKMGLPQRSSLEPPRSSIQELTNQVTSKINIEFIVQKTSQNLTKKELMRFFRKAVHDGISAAEPHRTWIAEIDRIARNARDLGELRIAISAYLRQAGITRVDDFSVDEERFIMTKKGEGKVVTTQPAYIDAVTGRTILAGRAYTQKIEQQRNSGQHQQDKE